MRLDKCVVHMLRDGVSFALLYLNEYHMATAVHTFHGEAAKVWVDHIRRAQVGMANIYIFLDVDSCIYFSIVRI